MQLLKTRALSLLVFVVLLSLSFGAVRAETPRVSGRVIYADTGEGIGGLVVKWQDSHDVFGGVRYTTTDASGRYVFLDFTNGDVSRPQGAYESTAKIDTDYDGVVDAPVWKVAELTESEKAEGFGCSQNPHTFTVLKRPGMIGEFENNGIIRDQVSLPNGAESINLPDIKFVKSIPQCPGNIRKTSCNQVDKTITVAWDAPPGGADGYRLYFDKDPVGVANSGDVLHPLESNLLQRTQAIAFDTRYLLRIKSLRIIDGQQVASESCLAELRCESVKCTPGQPGCCPEGDPTCNTEDPKIPTAILTTNRCVNYDPATQGTDILYANYFLQSIDLKGAQFSSSNIMVAFDWNASTSLILTKLGTPSKSDWGVQGRTPRSGDKFYYSISSVSQAPSGNRIDFAMVDSTRIGNTTIKDFRDYLKSQELQTSYQVIATVYSTLNGQTLKNDYIAANSLTNFTACGTPEPVCSETSSCTSVEITEPSGQTFVPVGNLMTVSWQPTSPTSTGTRYDVIIFNRNKYSIDTAFTKAAPGTPQPDIAYFPGLTSTTKEFFINNYVTLGDNLTIAVRGSCSNANCEWTQVNVDKGFKISGSFYKSDDIACGGTAPANLTNPVITVTASTGIILTPEDLDPDINRYRVEVPDIAPDSYNVSLTYNNPEYTCADCHIPINDNTCRIANAISSQTTNAHFYVKDTPQAFENSWWQVYGGQIYAADDISSDLPNPDDQDLFRLIKRMIGAEGVPQSAGLPIMGSSGNFGSKTLGFISERDNDDQLQVTNSTLSTTLKPDFAYYMTKLNPDTSRQIGEFIDNPAEDLSAATVQDRNGIKVFYRNGNVTIAPSEWNLNIGQHVVILVAGSIRFSGENQLSNPTRVIVKTPSGNTIMFIARDSIEVLGSVGNDNPTSASALTPNLEGIFIANSIIIDDGAEDLRFVGAGSFIGWSTVNGGIDLNRQLSDELNAAIPAETFIYRPDFVLNFPESLKDTSIEWKEVN